MKYLAAALLALALGTSAAAFDINYGNRLYANNTWSAQGYGHPIYLG